MLQAASVILATTTESCACALDFGAAMIFSPHLYLEHRVLPEHITGCLDTGVKPLYHTHAAALFDRVL